MSTDIDFDAIAERIHEFYRELSRKNHWRVDYSMPYSELPEYMKEDNRAAARRIGQVLALAGLRLVRRRSNKPLTKNEQAEMTDLIEQNIDLLAEGEHEGWMESRLRHGWRLGPCKDVDKRQSHLLVPYSRFPEQIERKQKHEAAKGTPPKRSVEKEVRDEKDKDRDAVRHYVDIIAQTNYRIAREEE
jgi:hypothetical protein